MLVSVCPSFYCNVGCSYCYLQDLRKNTDLLNPDILEQRLTELANKFKLESIDIFGGEVTLLHFDYIKRIVDICKKYGQTGVATNLYDVDKAINLNTHLCISFNKQRPDYKRVLTRLKKIKTKETFLHVVFGSDLSIPPSEFLSQFNHSACDSVSLTEYYPTRHTKVKPIDKITNSQYQDFMIGILNYYLKHRTEYSFEIVNLQQLSLCFSNTYNSFYNSNIFINPYGQYGCCVYDNEGYESFKWFNTLDEYLKHKEKEYVECVICPYRGHCCAEHIKSNCCMGNKKLMEWYKREVLDKEKL